LSIHVVGIIGLVLIFIIGTLRPINLGTLALLMTALVGSIFVGESVKEMYSGFPVDLLVLLAGVTYLFSIASNNGTVARVVLGAARLVKDRRVLIPWIVFIVAALPAMGGALGSAGVALLAPLSLRLAQRYDIDRRMIGLMVVHGAASGNFSPLNVLGAIVVQAVARNGLEMSSSTLFLGNLAYNVVLGAVIFVVFGGLRLSRRVPISSESALAGAGRSVNGSHDFAGSPGGAVSEAPAASGEAPQLIDPNLGRLRVEQLCTLAAILAVAVAGLAFGLNIGFLAFGAAAVIHLLFPSSSGDAEKKIAWGVVLLVCGIVTYVAALQRYGTVDAVGAAISGLSTPLVTALLICGVGAITSAFASSAGILGAMIPLAVPFMARGEVDTTGVVVALAISATVVDATPFSTVGALVVANAEEEEQPRIYRGLLLWGGVMVMTAPLLTWLVFIVAGLRI
jgi:di/tricarboxylate transporter